MNLTPDRRGVRWPRNFVEAPLPESMPKESKDCGTSQGYKDISDKLEEENSHVEIQRDVQFQIDATSTLSI
jgi:hypothetical protein